MTDLIEASGEGNLGRVVDLLEAGADVHNMDDKTLWRASYGGHDKVVKLLIDYGADVHAGDDEALRGASGEGHVKVVEILLEAGADVHAEDNNALRIAFEKKYVNLVKLLLDYGADKSTILEDPIVRQMREYVPVNPRRVLVVGN